MDQTDKQIKCFVLTVHQAPIFIFFAEDAAAKHYESFIDGKDKSIYGIYEVAAQSVGEFIRALTNGKVQFFEPLELSVDLPLREEGGSL